jgi:hypothetical protein
LVPKKGLEPPHPCEYMDLNHARLPIPPLRHCLHVANPQAGHSSRELPVFQTPCPLSIAPRLSYTETVSDRHTRRKARAPNMTEPTHPATQNGAAEIPEDLALEIRKLAHDLSNALEIIVQTSYLLGTVELKEPGSDWLRMLDNGVRKALDINLSLRTYIKSHSPH